MRLPLALLALALVTAGCFGGGDDDGGDPPSTTPTPDATPDATPTTTPTTSPTTSPTPASPTPTTTPPATPTPEPEAPEPAVVHETTYTYPTASAGGEATTESFDVAEGYTTLTLNVTFSPSTSAGLVSAGVADEATVKLRDPSGTDSTTSCVADGQVVEPVNCSVEVPVSEAGEWAVVFTGSGSVKADVQVGAS